MLVGDVRATLGRFSVDKTVHSRIRRRFPFPSPRPIFLPANQVTPISGSESDGPAVNGKRNYGLGAGSINIGDKSNFCSSEWEMSQNPLQNATPLAWQLSEDEISRIYDVMETEVQEMPHACDFVSA